MPSNQGEHLAGLIGAVKAITAGTVARFPGLTAQQLNWKPVPDQWSVAQCFDHLVTANNAFFPIFEKILSGEKKNSFWESLPWLPAIWGKMLIKVIIYLTHMAIREILRSWKTKSPSQRHSWKRLSISLILIL